MVKIQVGEVTLLLKNKKLPPFIEKGRKLFNIITIERTKHHEREES